MKRYANLRINLFLIGLLLLSGLVLYRLFVLSILRHSAYSRTAQAQSENINNVLARGNIYLSDKNSDILLAATNKKFPLAYAVPADIDPGKVGAVAEALSGILSTDKEQLRVRLDSKSESLRVLARRISTEQAEAVKNLKVKGIGVSYETDRLYPGEELAANIIGFLGYDAEGKRAGQYGIESYYDTELSGQTSSTAGLLGNPLSLIGFFKDVFDKEEKKEAAPVDNPDKPSDVVLSIDKNVQVFIQDKLKKTLEKWQAEKGVIIVQEPKTGKIIAMADWPSFNPNDYSSAKPEYFLNHSTQEIYEPGSSFKPVTMAAGLDLSKITPQTTYEDVGFLNISGYTIHNFSERVFGRQTMSQVLQNSVNTGTMFVENLVGDDNFLNYVINMGFGQRTGIDLPGEISGDVTNLYSGRKINFLTASFGQGIAVTPIQLVNAYSTIANGGKLMKPYIVDRIKKEDGEMVTKPEVVAIPISEKTASKLQTMLVGVVDNGFDKARIAGYDIAGKTGTAQIPDGTGSYSKEDFIHNFLGFAPAYDAKFTVLIKMDKPRGIQFAADSLSPTFKEIAAFLLNYYNIPPSRK